jgi:DNA mismatch endonuclease, patch repair protein
MTPDTTSLREPAPKPGDAATRLRMSRTRQRDNARELSLRSALHHLGFRFRLHQRMFEGSTRTADIVFPRAQLAIFMDGCFWHGCPVHASWPNTNADWWRKKIEANRRRDRDTDERLAAGGWEVLRVWEHEKLEEAVVRVEVALRERSRRMAP